MPVSTTAALVPRLPATWQKWVRQALSLFDGKRELALAVIAGIGNGADTTEDTLASYTLPAGALGVSPLCGALRISAAVRFAANGDNKTARLYFGSEVIATPTAPTNGKNCWLDLTVTRTGASQQRVTGRGCVDVTSVTPLSTTGAESETAPIVIKCTGQAGAANANDIICDQMIVETLN